MSFNTRAGVELPARVAISPMRGNLHNTGGKRLLLFPPAGATPTGLITTYRRVVLNPATISSSVPAARLYTGRYGAAGAALEFG